MRVMKQMINFTKNSLEKTNRKKIIAVVGAGGKTTLVKQLAKEYTALGNKVFVTTSTHMLIEEQTLLSDDAQEIIQKLEQERCIMAGVKDGEKFKGLSLETYEKVCEKADVVLVEADGSKHLPIKFPSNNEPVIYENVTDIIVVCGLHALGQPAKEVCQRLELAKEQLDISDETIITPMHIQNLVRKGYLETLKKAYPEKNIIIEATHNGSLYQRAIAALMKADMDVNLIKEEWFTSRPKLIICGGGHVSAELVKMASNLDFSIKVIDDRAEFANEERFPQADEVICDSFENLEQYLEPNAYYCVLTRGHQYDYACVRTILQHSYQYLGMIGSKRKVQTTFDKLREDGVSEEKISSVFAPIGLYIKAVTPAEIAVSIMAQIILEKNCKSSASASHELLDIKERGTLCIITEKNGSTPRGVGSMMFVGEKQVIDSIGGGAIEYAVLEQAKKQLTEPVIKEYYLNQTDSAELGMVCGGRNRVLFLPI